MDVVVVPLGDFADFAGVPVAPAQGVVAVAAGVFEPVGVVGKTSEHWALDAPLNGNSGGDCCVFPGVIPSVSEGREE